MVGTFQPFCQKSGRVILAYSDISTRDRPSVSNLLPIKKSGLPTSTGVIFEIFPKKMQFAVSPRDYQQRAACCRPARRKPQIDKGLPSKG